MVNERSLRRNNAVFLLSLSLSLFFLFFFFVVVLPVSRGTKARVRFFDVDVSPCSLFASLPRFLSFDRRPVFCHREYNREMDYKFSISITRHLTSFLFHFQSPSVSFVSREFSPRTVLVDHLSPTSLSILIEESFQGFNLILSRDRIFILATSINISETSLCIPLFRRMIIRILRISSSFTFVVTLAERMRFSNIEVTWF